MCFVWVYDTKFNCGEEEETNGTYRNNPIFNNENDGCVCLFVDSKQTFVFLVRVWIFMYSE